MTDGRPLLLVTRPLEAARRFAGTAEAAGFDTILAPMLTIRALPSARADFAGAQAVLLTSSAAAPMLARLTPDRDLPILAVGDATAASARDAGFRDVTSAAGDVQALAELAKARLDSGAGPVVHAAGAKRAGDLTGALAAAGFDARVSVLYEARPATQISSETVEALHAGKIAYAAFFSPQTARAFVSLAPADGVSEALRGVAAVAISAAVRGPLETLTWRSIATAARPDAAAVLEALVASAFGAAPQDGADKAG